MGPPLVLRDQLINACIMCRGRKVKDLELAPEMDALTKSLDVSMGVGVPMLASDHEMIGIVYRFNSNRTLGDISWTQC